MFLKIQRVIWVSWHEKGSRGRITTPNVSVLNYRCTRMAPEETWKVVRTCHMTWCFQTALIVNMQGSLWWSITGCTSLCGSTPPCSLPAMNSGTHKRSGAEGGKRWGKAGPEPPKLSHSCSSHWAAVLTYASSISSGVCISSRKLLPPGEKGRRWRRPGRCYKTSFLQLIKPPRTTYILSPPNEGTQSQNPVLLYY